MVHEHTDTNARVHSDRVRNQDLDPKDQRPLVQLHGRSSPITGLMEHHLENVSGSNFFDKELQCPYCRHKRITVVISYSRIMGRDNKTELYCDGCSIHEELKHDQHGFVILEEKWLASTVRPSDFLT